jgi:glycosyltransferase involved in cell wall biosynthesis
MASFSAKVTIIQRVLPHYRLPLYRFMAQELYRSGVEFQLIYGQEYSGTVPRTVPIEDLWGTRIRNRYFSVASHQLVWQPCLKALRNSDFVIFEQANSLLVNYWLLVKRRLGVSPRLAYWGHGRNLQTDHRDSLSEQLKRMLICGVDWWFAYTEVSAATVTAAGFPREKITVLNNAVDTNSLRLAIEGITVDELNVLRVQLGLTDGPVGLYCGGMYANKKLEFLLDACREIRRRVPSFQMIFVGDGPDQAQVELAAVENDWIKYVGPKFGNERAGYFGLADVFLMPGLVGLAILDSFAAGVPIFTTEIPIHSPEIAYLRGRENGFISSFSVQAFTDSVVNYLASSAPEKMNVVAACKASAESYSIENMGYRFVSGIRHLLDRVI